MYIAVVVSGAMLPSPLSVCDWTVFTHCDAVKSHDSLLLELWTCDRKVVSLNPGRRIFVSGVKCLC